MEQDYLDTLFKDAPERLTVADLSRILGASRPKVYEWIEEGAIPSYQLGKDRLIFTSEVKQSLRKKRHSST